MTEFASFLQWERASRDTIDFKKAYVDMVGDLIAGLMLSEIVYWYLPSKAGGSKLRIVHEGQEWIAVPRDEWWDRVRLTSKQADRAIGLLVKSGLLDKRIFRFQGSPTVHIRLLSESFLERWKAAIEGVRVEDGFLPKVKIEFDEREKSKSTKGEIPLTETTSEATSETKTQPLSEASIIPLPDPSQKFDEEGYMILTPAQEKQYEDAMIMMGLMDAPKKESR